MRELVVGGGERKIQTDVERRKKHNWEITHVGSSFLSRNPRRIFTVYFHHFSKKQRSGPIFIVSISYFYQAPICPSLRPPPTPPGYQAPGNEVFLSPEGGMKRAFVSLL